MADEIDIGAVRNIDDAYLDCNLTEEAARYAESLRPRILPDPPWRVLAKHVNATTTRWWVYYNDIFHSCEHKKSWANSFNLIVIPHPRNDPEAVKIIEDAKRTKEEGSE